MTALPPLANTHLDPMMTNVVNAYNICLQLQADARDDQNALLHARVLGYLILHTTTRALALDEVVKVIHSCGQDYHNLSQLGESFINYFIVPFKDRPRASFEHPSRDSSEDAIKTNLLEAPQDLEDAKNHALIRDGYRCVVSGVYDAQARAELGLTSKEVRAQGGMVHTQCAYILPESTYFAVQNGEDERDYPASVLAVLRCFCDDIEKINGANVHSLFNVMTMGLNSRKWFYELEMWFEKLGGNRYNVCSSDEGILIRRAEITFTTPDPKHLPVASEDLLELHAVCCKVAHFSGARQYIEKTWCDAELAEDGRSAIVLSNALLNQMPRLINPSENGRDALAHSPLPGGDGALP